jgi:hypothetical protein
VQEAIRLARSHPLCVANIKGGERQMSYLTNIANQRPMLRVTGEVLLVFCCATPLVLAFSSFVAYGLHSLTH